MIYQLKNRWNMATLATLKQDLADIQEKISEVITTGQEYSIVGSHSVKNTSLSDLRNQEQLIKKRIYRWQGYTGRVFPNFN